LARNRPAVSSTKGERIQADLEQRELAEKPGYVTNDRGEQLVRLAVERHVGKMTDEEWEPKRYQAMVRYKERNPAPLNYPREGTQQWGC
jgi:hypothetical protein